MRNRFTCCCTGDPLSVIAYAEERETTPYGNATDTSLQNPLVINIPLSPATQSIAFQTAHHVIPGSFGLPAVYQSFGFYVTCKNIPKQTYTSATMTFAIGWEQYSTAFPPVDYPKPTHGFLIRCHQQTFAPSANIITVNPHDLLQYSDPGIFWAIPPEIPRCDQPGTQDDRLLVTTPNLASIINPVLPVDTSRAIVLLFEPVGERSIGRGSGANFILGSKYRFGPFSDFRPTIDFL